MRHYTQERCPVCHRRAPCSALLFEEHTTANASQACSGSGKPTKLGKQVQDLMMVCTRMLVLVDASKGVKGIEGIEVEADNWGVTWWTRLPVIEELRRIVLESHQELPELAPGGLVWAPQQEGVPALAMGPTPKKQSNKCPTCHMTCPRNKCAFEFPPNECGRWEVEQRIKDQAAKERGKP